MNATVTVIIPTYSRADYIERAIESVINQTYEHCEIIVVDDNGLGTPNQMATESKINKYKVLPNFIYIMHDVNRNGSAARNTGIMNSHGSYITFLDDDDQLLPSKIEEQVRAIAGNDEYGGVYTGFRIISCRKVLKEVNPKLDGNLQYELLSLRWSIGTGSNPLYKRAVFDKIGLFDESFIRHQDIEFLVRFFRYFKIAVVPNILINRYVDSRINTPSVAKLEAVKYKFLKTFEPDISKYGTHKSSIIYREQYADIACHALKNKSYKISWKYYLKANSYKILSLKIIAKAILYGLLKYKVE